MNIFKEITFNEQLNDYVINDQRIFSDCIEFQLKLIRQKAKDFILEMVPDFKQRNAALGLLSEQEIDQIKTDIQNIRNISNQKEQEIFAVVWDGTEESRAVACDAVQAVRWE